MVSSVQSLPGTSCNANRLSVDPTSATDSQGSSSSSSSSGVTTSEVEKAKQVLEEMTCAICQDNAAQAVTTSCCDHLFCEACIKISQQQKNECPACRKSPFTYAKNVAFRRMIDRILPRCQFCRKAMPQHELAKHEKEQCEERIVKCDSTNLTYERFNNELAPLCGLGDFNYYFTPCEYACTWEGKFRDLDDHKMNCPFSICPNVNECTKTLKRQASFYGRLAPRRRANIPAPCIMQGFSTPKEHDKFCPWSKITCPLNKYGCSWSGYRWELGEHECTAGFLSWLKNCWPRQTTEFMFISNMVVIVLNFFTVYYFINVDETLSTLKERGFVGLCYLLAFLGCMVGSLFFSVAVFSLTCLSLVIDLFRGCSIRRSLSSSFTYFCKDDPCFLMPFKGDVSVPH